MSNSDFIYQAAELASTRRKQAGGTPSALHDDVTFFPRSPRRFSAVIVRMSRMGSHRAQRAGLAP